MADETSPYGLRWAIKRSFTDYILRMPDGRGVVGSGAIPTDTSEVVFPPVEAGRRAADDGTIERFWAFQGEVRFSGHYGMLSVRFADPRVEVRGERGELSFEGLPLVTLRIAPVHAEEGVEAWVGTEVALTEAGVALFNDVYPAGEPFEDLLITLPVRPPASPAAP